MFEPIFAIKDVLEAEATRIQTLSMQNVTQNPSTQMSIRLMECIKMLSGDYIVCLVD
jgi:hypothetical protein